MSNYQNIWSNTLGSIELIKLHDNLKDLDYISKKLLIDINNKNDILRNGLNDCKNCGVLVDSNSRKMRSEKRNQ